MEALWDDYFLYLIWKGGLQKKKQYNHLFKILHDIDFTWILERDDNREADGIDLRDDYEIPDCYTEYECEVFFERPCSVLEMLIALSIRVEDEFIGDPADEHPERFFMDMLKNLGLDIFKKHITKNEEDIIKTVIHSWMDRRFSKDGRGSPFPIQRDHRDQRKIEIWDQVIGYLYENYNKL